MKGKTHLGYIGTVLSVAVILVLVIAGFGYTVVQDIDFLAIDRADSIVLLSQGTVAGAEIEVAQVTIDGGEGTAIATEVVLNPEATYLEVLKIAAEEYGISFDMEQESTQPLIRAIDDQQNGTDGKYWTLYINEKRSPDWILEQPVTAGDSVVISFEEPV